MAKITTPDKVTGQQHTAAEYNAMKASINAVYDFLFENGLLGTIKTSALPESTLSPNQFETLGDGRIGLIGFENIGSGGGVTKLATPNPTATVISTTQINLTCPAIANADAYTWQRASNVNFTDAVNISTGSSPSFNNTGLTADTTYFFRVMATSTNPAYSNSNYAAISAKTNAAGATTPAAPTAFVVDDVANTANWTNTPTYTAVGDYEFTLDGGTTVNNVTVKPVSVGDVAKAAGQVGIRVKAATGRNASAWLFNSTPYTSAGGGTYIVEKTFRVNLASEYTTNPTGAPYWNTFKPVATVIQAANGFTSTSFVDDTNAASSLVFAQKNPFTGTVGEIASAQTSAGNTGIYPNNIVNTAWSINGSSNSNVGISGLNPAKFYQIYILMPSPAADSVRGATIGGVTKNKTATSILGSFGLAANGLNDPEWIVFNNITGSEVDIAFARVSGNWEACVSTIIIEQSNIAK